MRIGDYAESSEVVRFCEECSRVIRINPKLPQSPFLWFVFGFNCDCYHK